MTLQSRAEQAEWILTSAQRLVTFCKLDNPVDFVIEAERQLLLDKIIKFPVDGECQRMCLEQKLEMHQEEQKHLIETGFYDDAMKQLDGDTAGDPKP